MECWQVTVTICQHIIITLHTILVSTRNFVTARPSKDIFALLPCLQEKSKSDRATRFAKESGKKDWADKLSLATKGPITRSTSPRKLCRAVVCRWFCGFIHQCWSCRPESNLYCFLSSLLPFLPSCSHLGKHYFLGEFNFCFTEISGSCVIPSLAHSASPPISFPELRFPWPAVGKRELWEHPFWNNNGK